MRPSWLSPTWPRQWYRVKVVGSSSSVGFGSMIDTESLINSLTRESASSLVMVDLFAIGFILPPVQPVIMMTRTAIRTIRRGIYPPAGRGEGARPAEGCPPTDAD